MVRANEERISILTERINGLLEKVNLQCYILFNFLNVLIFNFELIGIMLKISFYVIRLRLLVAKETWKRLKE